MNSIKINYIVLLVTFILVITMKSIICGKGDEVKEENVEALETMEDTESESSDNYNLEQLEMSFAELKEIYYKYSEKFDELTAFCNEELKNGGFKDDIYSKESALKFAINHLSENMVDDMKIVSLKLYFNEFMIRMISCYTTSIDQNKFDGIDPPAVWCMDKEHRNRCIEQLKKAGINKNASTISIVLNMYLNTTMKIAETREAMEIAETGGDMFKKYFVDTSAILIKQCANFVYLPTAYCQSERYRTSVEDFIIRWNEKNN